MWFAMASTAIVGLTARVTHVATFVVSPSEPSSPLLEDAELFERLKATRLIAADPVTGRIDLPARDLALFELAFAAANGRPAPLGNRTWREKQQLIEALYRTPNGTAVRRQVARWNSTRHAVAVRDDRPSAVRPVGAAGIGPGVLPQGRTAVQWRVADTAGRPVPPSRLPVPERYGFIAPMLRIGMGDWHQFHPGTGIVHLMSTVTLSQTLEQLRIQVLGRLDLALSSLPGRPHVEWRCPRTPCGQANATGAEILVSSLPPGAHSMRLAVAPNTAAHLPVPDLAVAVHGTDVIWTGTERRAPAWAHANVTLSTADGHLLWQGANGLTDLAVTAGLLPIIGTGPIDRRSMIGAVARRPDRKTPASLRLTIHSRVQEAAQNALDAGLQRAFGQEDPYRDLRRASIVVLDPDSGAILAAARSPRLPGPIHAWDLAAGRRGDPIRDPQTATAWHGVNTDNTPGSVFKLVTAFAALLAAERDTTLAAMLDGCQPDHAGRLICAGLDAADFSYGMPGQHRRDTISNFEDKPLRHSLRKAHRSPTCGGSARPAHSFGLDEALRDSVNIWFVKLAERLDLETALSYDKAARRRRLPEGLAGADHATRQLALADRLPDLGETHLLSTARLLGLLDTQADLAGTARHRLETQPRRTRAGFILVPDAAELELAHLTDPAARRQRPAGAVDTLAQTAIGQRIRISPLQAARLVAAIATGTLPSPYLIGDWNGEGVSSPKGPPLPAQAVAHLRDAMKLVPETGTARGAFSKSLALRLAACHVYGKTGTGQSGRPNTAAPSDSDAPGHLTSAWFVGWAKAEAFHALVRGRSIAGAASVAANGGSTLLPGPTRSRFAQPLAFACMVSHGYESHHTGGAVCGRIMADMLDQLAQPLLVPVLHMVNHVLPTSTTPEPTP